MCAMRIAASFLLAALAAAEPLAAQGPLMRGSRVRVWTEGAAVVGTLVSRTNSSLVLVADGARDTVAIPLRAIAGLELSRGRHVRVWPMVLGILGGGMVGGLAEGAIRGKSIEEIDTAASWGALAGMVVGGLIASRYKADSWSAIDIPAPAPPAPVAAAGLPAGISPPETPPYVVPFAVPAPVAAAPVPAVPERKAARELPAAPPGVFAPGARIRYSTGDVPALLRTVRLVGLEGDTIVVQREATVGVQRLPLSSLTTLEVSTGRHGHVIKGLIIGTLIGAAGTCPAAAVDKTLTQEEQGAFCVVGTSMTASMGAGVGALVRHEGWRPVERPAAPRPVSVRLGVAGSGRVRIGVALRH